MSTVVYDPDTTAVMQKSLLQTLEYGLDQHADTVALHSTHYQASIYELDEYSTFFAAFLQVSADLRPGELLAIDGIHSPAGIVAFYAAIRTGLKVLLINSDESIQKVDELVDHNVRALVHVDAGRENKHLFGSSQVLTLQPDEQAFVWTSLRTGTEGRFSIDSKRTSVAFNSALTKVDPGRWLRPSNREQSLSAVLWCCDSGELEQFVSGDDVSRLTASLGAMLVALLRGQAVNF